MHDLMVGCTTFEVAAKLVESGVGSSFVWGIIRFGINFADCTACT